MKIVVLDIAASKTGALSILRDFYEYVSSLKDSNEWIFITGMEDALEERTDGSIKIICRPDVKASSRNRLKFDLFTGAGFIESLKPDVLFSLQNTLPRGLKGMKKVLYVHQPLGYQKVKRFSFLRSEERPLAIYQYLYSILVNSSVRASDVTIVQTEWMKDAVKEKTGKKEVIKISPDIPDIMEYGAGAEFNRNSFFYPAGDILYKNHAVIEEAAGMLKKEGTADIELIFTNKKPMTRPEVCRQYFCSTLIFPSYIETFGLPLAEAVQTGNPILAADTPFAREILSDYDNAYRFDPFNAVELKELMKKVIEGKISPSAGRHITSEGNSYGEITNILTGKAF